MPEVIVCLKEHVSVHLKYVSLAAGGGVDAPQYKHRCCFYQRLQGRELVVGAAPAIEHQLGFRLRRIPSSWARTWLLSKGRALSINILCMKREDYRVGLRVMDGGNKGRKDGRLVEGNNSAIPHLFLSR